MRLKRAAEDVGEGLDRERLGQARDAFEEEMAAGQEADQDPLEHRVLADDHAPDLEQDRLGGGARVGRVGEGAQVGRLGGRFGHVGLRCDVGSLDERAGKWLASTFAEIPEGLMRRPSRPDNESKPRGGGAAGARAASDGQDPGVTLPSVSLERRADPSRRYLRNRWLSLRITEMRRSHGVSPTAKPTPSTSARRGVAGDRRPAAARPSGTARRSVRRRRGCP